MSLDNLKKSKNNTFFRANRSLNKVNKSTNNLSN